MSRTTGGDANQAPAQAHEPAASNASSDEESHFRHFEGRLRAMRTCSRITPRS
jgi:hypothetical protein